MNKKISILLILILTASSLIMLKPAYSSENTSTNAVENTWTQKAPMQQARSNLGIAAVNGKIYAIGGSAENYTAEANEEYNPTTNAWSYKEPMPIPRYNFAVAVYQNKIYCIGGTSNGNTVGVNEVYDPITNSWATKAPMPSNRSSLSANVVDGKIYLIDGFASPNEVSSLNEVYNPSTDSWTTANPIPRAAGYVSAVVNGKIYVIDSGANQIYDPSNDTWTQGAAPTLSREQATSTPWSAVAASGFNAPQSIYVFTEKSLEIYNPTIDKWTFGADLPTDRVEFGVALVDDLVYVVGGFKQTYQNYPEDWIYGPTVTIYGTNEQYTPFGYASVAPQVSVVSPESINYSSSEVWLNFTVSKSINWTVYSLDGKGNITIMGNTTITGLTVGLHNITVYAKDVLGNEGASETVEFTVASATNSAFTELFPTVFVVAVSILIATATCACVALYLRKRKITLKS